MPDAAETETGTGTELAAKRAADQASRFREATEDIRKRNDTTAKALGSVGTAAVAAVGYAQFANLFPVEGCTALVALPLVGGVVLMAVAVVLLMRRFQDASKAVVTTADLARTLELNELEAGDPDAEPIEQAYGQAADLNEVETLSAYQARAHRFERIAEHSEDPKRAADLRGRADLIAAEVLAAQARAGALVVRRRARDGLYGRNTLLWILAFVAGLYISAVSADYLESERKQEDKTVQVDLAERCVKLAEAKLDPLPDSCGKVAEKKSPDPTVAGLLLEPFKSLATGVIECPEIARKTGKERSACAELERAYDAVRGATAVPPPRPEGG